MGGLFYLNEQKTLKQTINKQYMRVGREGSAHLIGLLGSAHAGHRFKNCVYIFYLFFFTLKRYRILYPTPATSLK